MSVLFPEIHGRDRILYAALEDTPGVFKKPVALNAIKVLQAEIKAMTPKTNAEDSGSQATIERIPGIRRTEWSIGDAYMRASGDPDDAPNIAGVLKAVFGTQTPTGLSGGPHAWTLLNGQNLGTLSIYENFASEYARTSIGSVVNELVMKGAVGKEPKFSASGLGMRFAHARRTLLENAVVADDEVTLQEADAILLDSLIQVGTENLAGAGLRVTAKNGAVLTLDDTIDAADNAVVFPYAPTPGYLGIPIPGIYGGFTVDAEAAGIIEAEVKITRNFEEQDEMFNTETSDFSIGDWLVEVLFKMRARRDRLEYLTRLVAAEARALSLTFGSGSGRRFTAALPTVEFDEEPLAVTGKEVAIITLKGTALGTSPITLTHQ